MSCILIRRGKHASHNVEELVHFLGSGHVEDGHSIEVTAVLYVGAIDKNKTEVIVRM
jgi:hypothetical protein